MEDLKMILKVDMAYILTITELDILEIGLTIKRTDMELKHGLMEQHMKVNILIMPKMERAS